MRIVLYKNWFVLAVSCGVALDCSGSSPPQGGSHPDPTVLTELQAPALTLDVGSTAPVPATGDVFADPHSPLAVHLGVLNAPAMEAFGHIKDVAIIRGGDIAILDADARQVRIFDKEGRFLQASGSHGRGPGEFVHPLAMHAQNENSLAVFDEGGRVTFYDVAEDSIRYSHGFRFEGEVFDGCIINDRVYVHGYAAANDYAIHAFTIDGEHTGSFGELYPAGNRLIRQQLSNGRIACSERLNLVLFAPGSLPQVRVYGRDGHLAWWISIDGFLPIEATELDNGSRLRMPERGAHSLATLVASQQGHVVLQIGFARPNRGSIGNPTRQLHTFVISTEDRTAAFTGEHIPWIFHWSSQHIVFGEFHPFPKVMVLQQTANADKVHSSPSN